MNSVIHKTKSEQSAKNKTKNNRAKEIPRLKATGKGYHPIYRSEVKLRNQTPREQSPQGLILAKPTRR